MRSGNKDSVHPNLPDNFLAATISRLAWRERIVVERVSRQWRRVSKSGMCWTDFTCFDNKLFAGEASYRAEGFSDAELQKTHDLLARCGRHVRKLSLHHINLGPPSRRWTDRLVDLCPHVRHLRLYSIEIDSRLIHSIERVVSRTLQSLNLHTVYEPDSGSTGHCISEATLAALNSLLRGASQLEALSVIQQITQTRCLSRLRIPSWVRLVFVHDQADYFAVRPESPNSRALSATAAANEWCFLNGTIFRPRVRSSNSMDAELKLGGQGLRSLNIYQPYGTPLYSCLAPMMNLDFLALDTDARNNAQLATYITFMPNLRALNLSGKQTSLFSPISRHCPLVEVVHVQKFDATDNDMRLLADFEKLVALSVCAYRELEEVDWRFLVRLADRGRLQWLGVGWGPCPPAKLVGHIVEQCKDLRVLCLTGFAPDTQELVACVDAALDERTRRYGDDGAHTPLIIYTNIVPRGGFASLCIRDHSRLVLRETRCALRPPLLYRYKYGCLEAGRPAWRHELLGDDADDERLSYLL